MMIYITKKSSKVFFTTIVVSGIIAIFSQSFIIGAQALQDPIVDVEKLKCNNDNFNIDVTNPQVLSEVANKIQSLLNQEAAENRERPSMDDDHFVLFCTNSDNNLLVHPVG